MRGRAVHDALRLLDEFEDGKTAEARALVPAASLRTIDTTSALGWVEIDDDHHVPASVITVLGRERADKYFRWLLTRQLETPLLKASWAATRKLFGLSPAALARAVPVGWPAVYRNFCTTNIHRQRAHEVALRLSEVHPSVFEFDAYAISFAGFFGGFFEACDVEGSVESEVDRDERRIDFVLRWE